MKWFRVATEGATTDGRKIAREWIEQMAKNFDPKKYGARVWLEHMRGLFADGPLPALGDVTALKAEEVEDGKLALFAQIDPTDRLKEINADRQKIYTSIEVDPEFSDTGEAYLVGLAVTDSPASLGTDMLQFSAQRGSESPLASRKQKSSNVFSAAVEADFDFSDMEETEEEKPSLLDNVRALFKKHNEKTKGEFSDFRNDLEATLGVFVERCSSLEDELKGRPSAEAFDELSSSFNELKGNFEKLYKQLDFTPDTPERAPAKGSEGGVELTDC
jgi:hypothetical protein